MTVPRRLPRPARARAAALAGTALAVSAALGGCSMFSEQTTQNVTYAPSDGAQAEVGPVGVRNLMVLSAGQGGSAIVIGSLFNSSDEDIEVMLDVASGAAQQTYDVPAGGSLTLGPDGDEELELDTLDVVPGRTVPVSVIGGQDSANLMVPVLDSSLPEYADLVPTGSADS